MEGLRYNGCFTQDTAGNRIFVVKFRLGRSEVFRWYPTWNDLRDLVLEATEHERASNKGKNISDFQLLAEAILRRIKSTKPLNWDS